LQPFPETFVMREYPNHSDPAIQGDAIGFGVGAAPAAVATARTKESRR
jgi:hypothetical protein